MSNNNSKVLLCVLGCMLGPALGGYFIGKSIERFKLNDRVVVVKGLSEKEVKSDLAVWQISYKNSGNDLLGLDKKSIADKEVIEAFLVQLGFTKEELSSGPTEVVDKSAREYDYSTSSSSGKTDRYIMTGKLTLRTAQVDLISQAQEKIRQLLQNNVIVSGSPSFY